MPNQPISAAPHPSTEVQQLATRLKGWRESRQPGQRIPPELWKAAADLARVHGLSPAASALKLNYYDLQRRAFPKLAPGKAAAPRPAFVQLPAPAWSPGPSEASTLEVHRTCGARLTLRLAHATTKDLMPLVQMFLRQRS